jgi:hypothetical protein
MTRKVSQRELCNDGGTVLRATQAGEGTANGTAVVELRPLRRKRFLSGTGLANVAAQPPAINDRLRADLDAVTDQRIDG